LRLHERELSAPVASLSDGLVRPSPEGPSQDEGRCRRGTAECPGQLAGRVGSDAGCGMGELAKPAVPLVDKSPPATP